MTATVTLVADAGDQAGLGHISRSSAVAIALRCRGIETRCYAIGIAEAFERDGVSWSPLAGENLLTVSTGVLVVDSYRLPPEALAAAAASARLVLMHDQGDVPAAAALVIAAAAQPAGDERHLNGLAYAALRPSFWGLPARAVRDPAARIVVTVGGGQLSELGSKLALAAREAFPEIGVALVRGPQASFPTPAGIESIDAPDSLLEPLLKADIVISAGGQTMLEAAACGTPCVALAVVENQRQQVLRLAALNAVRPVYPPDVTGAVAAARALAGDVVARGELSRNGQRVVDGYGALRVAFHVGGLLEERG